MKLCIVIDFSD